MEIPGSLAAERNGYLTTTGRKSGTRYTKEIWFGVDGETIYLLTGRQNRTDWLKNLTADPHVSFRIADQGFAAEARIVDDAAEGRRLRELMVAKYKPIVTGWDIDDWAARLSLSRWTPRANRSLLSPQMMECK